MVRVFAQGVFPCHRMNAMQNDCMSHVIFLVQPVYHSEFNDTDGEQVAGCLVLPLREGPRGPAPVTRGSDEQRDLVDEAIAFFRANVLFRSFEIMGPADRVLVYLTLFTQQCLRHAQKYKTKQEAARALRELSTSRFTLPGDPGFVLPSMFRSPASAGERDRLQSYLKQVREALATRLVEHIYWPDGTPHKFWMAFHKKKFMGLEMK